MLVPDPFMPTTKTGSQLTVKMSLFSIAYSARVPGLKMRFVTSSFLKALGLAFASDFQNPAESLFDTDGRFPIEYFLHMTDISI